MAKRVVSVDMTGVETFSKVSEGIHTVRVKEINTSTTQAGDDALQVVFEVTKGNDKGGRLFETFTLIDKALWKFKAFLKAVGAKHEGKIKIDLDKLIGKICDVEVFWDEYNGQTYAKISDYYPLGKTSYDDMDEAEDEEEEVEQVKPKKRGRPAKKAAKKPEPEEDDDEEEDDDFDDDDDDEEEEVEQVKPKKRGRPAKKAAKKPEPEEDDDEEEDDDFDDDDDDEWDED
jgi:hypothetical protein